MRCIEGNIAEERIAPISPDVIHRRLGDALRQVAAILEYLRAVAPEIVIVGHHRLAPVVAVGEVVHAAAVKAVEVVEAVPGGRRLIRVA